MHSGQAAPATASTSQLEAAPQLSAGTPSTTHPAADLLAARLATSSTPPAKGDSPPPQLPVPVKKKQYKAEPTPSFPPAAQRSDALEPAATAAAAVGAYVGSGAEKQVELRFQSSTSTAIKSFSNDKEPIMKRHPMKRIFHEPRFPVAVHTCIVRRASSLHDSSLQFYV